MNWLCRLSVGGVLVVGLAFGAGCDETTDDGMSDASSGDDSDANVHSIRIPDGGTFATSCAADPIDAYGCGVAEGLPFYGYYDGCNWVSCLDGSRSTTARLCTPETIAFTEADCVATYYGAYGVELPEGETWVCDATGRLYRSACAPSVTTPLK